MAVSGLNGALGDVLAVRFPDALAREQAAQQRESGVGQEV